MRFYRNSSSIFWRSEILTFFCVHAEDNNCYPYALSCLEQNELVVAACKVLVLNLRVFLLTILFKLIMPKGHFVYNGLISMIWQYLT
jgi:hypothetical protein